MKLAPGLILSPAAMQGNPTLIRTTGMRTGGWVEERMIYLLLLACASPPPPAATPAVPSAPVAPAAAPAPSGPLSFGAPVDLAAAIPVDQLVASPDQYAGKELTVTGTVREVCQKKGCWHTLATASPDTSVRVKDKEYEIFLPKDCAGRKIAVKGTFSVETIPLEEARHYAQDAGKDPNSITEAKPSFEMEAAGVTLL
jgi:hypothetical protein